MILTHGANSISRYPIYVEGPTIGGRKYKAVKIGSQIWLAENLDYKFSGCVVGASGTSSSEPRGNYYDNDETTYGLNGNRYGLLYNQVAAKYLNNNSSLLPSGWRVPSVSDYNILASAVGDVSIVGTKLKSKIGWVDGAGTDYYGFDAVPSGDYAGSFNSLGTGCSVWTADATDSSHGKNVYFMDSSSAMGVGEPRTLHQMAIRLVKSIT